jgi:DTW domain-containing protein YfiP
MKEQQQAHVLASKKVHEYIEILPPEQGKLKHELLCQHRYNYGKYPFVCNSCWTYKPICLCRELALQNKLQLPNGIQQVILWTHHREWASVSNSGSLLPLVLEKTKLLMKGLPEHDLEFETLVKENEGHVIVLWPDNDKTPDNTKEKANQVESKRLDWQELLEWLGRLNIGAEEDDRKGLTLVAMEGTWRTARRMVAKLPPGIIRVALTPDQIFWRKQQKEASGTNNNNKRSILAQLRRQRGTEFSQSNICTAEAVTAALVSCGMQESDGHKILDVIRKKVDMTRRFQGKKEKV